MSNVLHDALIEQLTAMAADVLAAEDALQKARQNGDTLAPLESKVKSLRSASACLSAAGNVIAAQTAARAAADFRELPGYLKRALIPVGPVEVDGELLPF